MEFRYKPLFIITPGSMTKRDMRRAEKLCGICIAESKDPSNIRFLDPPLTHDIGDHARAALELSRWMFGSDRVSFSKSDIMQWFLQMILKKPLIKKVEIVKK